MKSFTSAILAAAVSANYCYSDGCNCNGETRACYSLPRQNMRPAVNTCCPVGVQPTVYGRDNGRSVNIPQTASLLKGESNETWSPTASLKKPEPMCCRNKCQAAGMEKFVSIDTKHGHCGEACMKPSDFSLYKKFERNLEATTSDTPCKDAGWPVYFETETHGVWPINMTVDLYSQEAPNCAQQCKDTCCNNGGGDACVKACGCEHACPAWSPTSSLMTGTSSSTWSPTARLNANFVDCRDYSLYCCQEWNRFEYECILKDLPASNTSCSSVVSAAKTAGITADSPGTCAQTSTMKTRTWESKQNAPDTTCKTDCGIKININQPEEPTEEPEVIVAPVPQPEEPVVDVEPEQPETPEETNWTNNNEFTLFNYEETGGKTTCKTNCGITFNVNE